MHPVPRALAAVLLACTLALAAGCGSGNRPGTGEGTGPGSGAAVAEPGSYAVTVRDGATAVRLDPGRLAGLRRASVDTPASAGETRQTGPTLLSVLDAAGVRAPDGVRVVGPSESVMLTAADIRPDLLLADTKRGTVKLAGPGLDPSRWVRDVTDVEVTG